MVWSLTHQVWIHIQAFQELQHKKKQYQTLKLTHVDILRPTTTERCPLRVAKNQEFVNGWDYDMISTSERCPSTVEAVCGGSSVLYLMFIPNGLNL